MNTDKPASDLKFEIPASPTQNPGSHSPESTGKSGPPRPLTLWIAAIIAFVALADQLTKNWALATLSDIPGRSISVIGDFLRWTLVYNEGGAMGTNLGGSMLYTVVGIAILLALGYYLWQYRYAARVAIPLALIAGGAIGNLIDRFVHGKVVDWIDVNFFDISLFSFHLERWWTFNIADSAISVALVYMLWQSLRPEKPGAPIAGTESAAQDDNIAGKRGPDQDQQKE